MARYSMLLNGDIEPEVQGPAQGYYIYRDRMAQVRFETFFVEEGKMKKISVKRETAVPWALEYWDNQEP
jgi:hypothetical protein